MKDTGSILAAWLRARRLVLAYTALVFACFFIVYALYGHSWAVAGYAALLSAAAGLALAVWDMSRFAARHILLALLAGRFPTGSLPPMRTLIEADYAALITALEAERARLEQENERQRRDAEEYYTLWAHQIKTPMAAMGLVLQSGEGALTARERADVRQELFRIGQYVDMVLQYQRLSTLESDLVLKPFELKALASQAGRNCAQLFIHKGLPLHLQEVRGRVVTDEKWFCFVLEQLYTNAVKYTSSGQVRVYTPSENTLVIEDTGSGIPAEDLPRVFERGFTGAIGRAERSSTGIGLYLCKQILARLGFGISIESTLGKGTRVLLRLHQPQLEVE